MSSSLVVKSTCRLLHFWPSAVFFYDTNNPILDHITELIYSRLSHIDNINHTNLLVAVALLFPLMWRLVLITEPSRGLTQFVNPRVPLSASLLRSLLCRAEPGPLPGWEWGWWRWWWGETGRDGSQHWGPMQGCRRWIAGRRGGGVTGGRERGTGWAWLAKEHLAYRHTATQLCGTHSMGSLHRFVCVWWGRCIYYFRSFTAWILFHKMPFFCKFAPDWIAGFIFEMQSEVKQLYQAVKLRVSILKLV